GSITTESGTDVDDPSLSARCRPVPVALGVTARAAGSTNSCLELNRNPAPGFHSPSTRKAYLWPGPTLLIQPAHVVPTRSTNSCWEQMRPSGSHSTTHTR